MSRRARASLGDPCIPKHETPKGNANERNRAYGPSQGRFIDYGGGTLVLADMAGGMWPAEKVRHKVGSFGFSAEGLQKAPRPWLFAGDEVVVEGDWYMIHFLHGDPAHPVVDGGIGSMKPEDTEFFHPNPIGQDPNPIRMRAAAIDPASGAKTGTLEIRALDGGNKVAIVVGGPTFGTGVSITLDYDAGTFEVSAGGTLSQAALGEAVVDALATLATDLVTVAGVAGTTVPDTSALLVELEASLLAGGPPFLSTVVRHQ